MSAAIRSTTPDSSAAGAGLLLTGLPLFFSSIRARVLLLDQGTRRVLVTVGELGRIEVAGLLRHDLLGDVEHLGIGLGQVGMSDLVERADLPGGAQGRQHQPVLLDLDGTDALARAHDEAADGHQALALHGFADHREGLDAGLARGHEVIGRVPVEMVDRLARYELLDVDDAGRFELDALEIFRVEQDVLVLGDGEAPYEVAARRFLAGAGVDRLHPDAVVGLRIDQVETDRLGLGRRRLHRHRTGHEGKAQMPFPARSCSHYSEPLM